MNDNELCDGMGRQKDFDTQVSTAYMRNKERLIRVLGWYLRSFYTSGDGLEGQEEAIP